MTEDSRNYAWVAALVIGLLLLVGGGLILASLGTTVSSPVLTPVAVPAKAPAGPSSASSELTGEAAGEGSSEVPGRVRAGETNLDTASEPSNSLRLTVLHADGTPAGGALCVLFTEPLLHDLGETDAEGRCTLRGEEGSAELLVLGATIPAFRMKLAGGSGDVSVSLPEGAVISGVLLVDGVPPTERSFVELDHWEEGLEFLRRDLRWQARIGERESRWSQAVGADGSFRFSGLSADWSGDLDISRELWLEEGGQSFNLEAPREGIVLRATRRPILRGRVLLPDGETPAAFAILRMEFSRERASRTWDDATDAEGRIAIGIVGGLEQEQREPYDHAELEIYDVERKGYRKLEVTLEPLQGKDLGDIILNAARDVPFVALDAVTGEAVEGALAYSGGNRAEPTGADGRSVLRGLPPDRFELQVLSLTHVDTTVPVPLQIQGEIEARLERATTLEVVVQTPNGEPVEGVDLRLEGDCVLFSSEEPTHPAGLHVELGASDSGNSIYMTGADGSFRVETNFSTDASGRCLLVGVDPECAFSLEVHDAQRHPLFSEEVIQLEPGEHRRLDVVSPRLPGTLRGVARDELGGAVAEALVHVRSSDIKRNLDGGALARRPEIEPDFYEGQGRRETNSAGEWSFEGLFSERVDLLVTAEGFESLVLRDVEVPTNGAPLEFVLRQPRSLEIRLLAGEESLAKDIVNLSAFADGWRLTGLDYVDGRWVVASPPDLEIELRASCAERTFESSALPTDNEIDWELPPLGTVRVSWDFPTEQPGGRSVQLVPKGAPDEMIGVWISEGRDEQSGSREFRAFPGNYEAVMLAELGEGQGLVPITTRVPVEVRADNVADGAIEVELALE